LIRACCLEEKDSLKSFKLWLAEGYDQSDLPFHLHRLIPTLFTRVPSSSEFDRIRERYRAVYRHAWASNTIRMNYTRQAIDLLAENGIVAALHNEILANLLIYPEIGNRFIQEVDLLISPRDRSRALKLLGRSGWNETVLKEQKLFEVKHCANLRRGSGESLRVHWYLFKEYRNDRAQSELMGSLETIMLCGRPCQAIPINTLFYQTLISLVQIEGEGFTRLVDAYFLIHNFTNKIDFSRIGLLAQECHRGKIKIACEIFDWVFETSEMRPLKLELARAPIADFLQQAFVSPIIRRTNRLNFYSGFYKSLP
jgi:hypothetical protein